MSSSVEQKLEFLDRKLATVPVVKYARPLWTTLLPVFIHFREAFKWIGREVEVWQVVQLVILLAQYVVAFILPTTFLLYLLIRHDPVVSDAATPWFNDNPHYTLLVVTLISSLLAWVAKHLFSTMVEWVAEVTSYESIELGTVEFLAALKSNSALVKRDRRFQSLVTWASVITLALLSAGYTTLLLPLPISMSESSFSRELDLASQLPTCADWYRRKYVSISNSTCGPISTSSDWSSVYNGSTCPDANLNDIVTSALLAMNSAMYEIELPTGLAPSQLNPLSLRNITGVPFVGITGGALPQGPQTTVPNAASIYDYLFEISWNSVGNASSHLQGLAVNVSCQPVPSVPIAVSLSSSSSNVSLSGTCPDGSSKNWTVPFSDGGMAVLNCPNTSESGVTGNQTLYIATLGSPGIVSVGNLTCQISAQIANGVMLQNTSGSSNTYTWEGDETVTASSLVPAFDVLRESIAGMTAALTLGQTNAGNLFVGTLQTVLLSSGGSFVWPGIDSESALVAKLVEAMLEGVISFEASLIRLVFALQQIQETYDLRGYGSLDYPFHPNPSIASTMVDERCFRDVQAFYFWNDIGWAGWDQHSHVLIAFLPIGLMGAVIPFLFVWVWRRRARGYNKTNLLSPVVLLARPSQRLREETLVDLEDPPSSHTILNFQRTRDGDRDWAGGFVLLNSSVRPSSPTSSIRSQIHDKDGYLQVDGEVD